MITAPVERLFSMGGKIFRPYLCGLIDQTFERLIFITIMQGFVNDKLMHIMILSA